MKYAALYLSVVLHGFPRSVPVNTRWRWTIGFCDPWPIHRKSARRLRRAVLTRCLDGSRCDGSSRASIFHRTSRFTVQQDRDDVPAQPPVDRDKRRLRIRTRRADRLNRMCGVTFGTRCSSDYPAPKEVFPRLAHYAINGVMAHGINVDQWRRGWQPRRGDADGRRSRTARWDNSMVLMKGTEGAKLCQVTSTTTPGTARSTRSMIPSPQPSHNAGMCCGPRATASSRCSSSWRRAGSTCCSPPWTDGHGASTRVACIGRRCSPGTCSYGMRWTSRDT